MCPRTIGYIPYIFEHSIQSQGGVMGWLRKEAGPSDPRKEFRDAFHMMSDHWGHVQYWADTGHYSDDQYSINCNRTSNRNEIFGHYPPHPASRSQNYPPVSWHYSPLVHYGQSHPTYTWRWGTNSQSFREGRSKLRRYTTAGISLWFPVSSNTYLQHRQSSHLR